MDDPHLIDVKEFPLMLVETLVPIMDSPNLRRTIVDGQSQKDLSDDHIESRAQPTAGDNSRANFFRFEE